VEVALLIRLFRHMVKPIPASRREKLMAEIRPQASPGFDFFLLVVLSCSIATLGLIIDSPAVIIGAMLVAPLMSPIVGIGLASITGDTHMLRNGLSALVRGAVLAIALSALVTFVNSYLPIVSLHTLPAEVVARTRPTPIDLVIALAGGLAAAYAMTQPNLSAALPGVAIATALMPPLCTIGIGVALNRWDVAGGALLLFATNTVTIAFAAVLVFFLRGFGIGLSEGEPRLPRSLLLSAGLTLIMFIPLNYLSVKFFQDAADNRRVNEVVKAAVQQMAGGEITQMQVLRNGSALDMDLTIQASNRLTYGQVVDLQETIVKALDRPVSLKVNEIIAERLDPLIPPTHTATPTLTPSFTLGPSPTHTRLPTLTPTASATATPSPTFTPTPLPTSTPTFTVTPHQMLAATLPLPAMRIYQSPGGPVIGSLRPGQVVTLLYRQQVYAGLVWVEIRDAEGRLGWVPLLYLQAFTETPTPINTQTATITPVPSLVIPSATP
jgi:uncharacterized hydrophobic protein (TIGR00271 family)